MRELLKCKPRCRGSSTLEILIAFVIITLALTAAVALVFSNQSLAVDIETTGGALAQAQSILEVARATAQEDFNMLNATSGLLVTQTDRYTKKADAIVSYISSGRPLSIVLSTLITNPEGAQEAEACSSVLAGDWTHPQLGAEILLGSAGGNPITAMAAADKKLYVTTSDTAGHNNDFYIYDASRANPALLSSIDANGVAPGLNGLAISSTTAGLYVYAANGNTPNWSTCSESKSCSHLQIVDVSRPSGPLLVRNYKIPSAQAPFLSGTGGQGTANTVVYKNGYLYVGLAKTASGPEFVILDAGAGGSPASPATPVYRGGYVFGRGVNAIVVKGEYAYIATTDNAREMVVLNISNPAAPTLVSSFNAPGSTGFGAGNALARVGTRLYLGRNYVSNAPEWYALDLSAPLTPVVVASLDLGPTGSPQSVNAIMVRDYLAFITTKDFFQIWNIAIPATSAPVAKLNMASMGTAAVASACEGNTMYVGGYKTADDHGVLYQVTPGT